MRASPFLKILLQCPRRHLWVPRQARALHLASRSPRAKPPSSSTINTLGDRNREAAALAQDKKQFNRLALATALCMVITGGLAYLIYFPTKQTLKADAPSSSSSSSSEAYQGKPVTILAGGAKIVAHDNASGEDVLLAPTGSKAVPHFPKTIHLPAADGNGNKEYSLVGLGVRTVSFLAVQVYVVGLYVETASSLSALQSHMVRQVNPQASALILGEKADLRRQLLGDESHAIWNLLLQQPGGGPDGAKMESALRIVPIRNTDFRHMLDGWVRGITQRSTQLAATYSDEFADESFGRAVKQLTALFAGRGKSPKGSIIWLARDGEGRLDVMYDATGDGNLDRFGRVEDERIARLIWLTYLGGAKVSAGEARKSIVDGVIELVERPVGTAASKVE